LGIVVPIGVMSKILIFGRAVIREWSIFTTSGVLIGGIFIYQGIGHPVAPAVFWAIGVGGVFVALYRVWLREYQRAEAESKSP
jgi:hypothetical protein